MTPAPNVLDLFVLLATLVTVALIYTRNNKRSALPYPPGPWKLPVLGNLLDFPTSFEWETFAQWGKEYSSGIIHLSATGKHFIALNSFHAAIDLLEKRSSTYSSRPQSTMVAELMGWKWLMSRMAYGEPWRKRRRAFAKYFQGSNTTLYRAPQMEFVRKMLPRLLDNPEDFRGITRHTIGGMALSLAYGLPIQDSNDPYINLVEQALASVGEAGVPGSFWVDMLPILKYIPEFVPGAGFKKKARASGIAKTSFTSTCLQNLDESPDVGHQEEVIKDTAGIVFAAGDDTSVSGILTFFVAMLGYPETQRKAQQELDRVLGGRLPEFSDEPDLPYVSALLKEVLRWKAVTPIGVPHYSSEDVLYEGYYIPKGATVIANVWAMLSDEDEYPDPSAFKPERFLKDGQLNPAIRDPALMAFGFGRRICPGREVALSFLWLSIATILATFDISKAVNDDGVPIEPSIQYQSATISHPLPFKCTIKVRSKAAEELIRQEILGGV